MVKLFTTVFGNVLSTNSLICWVLACHEELVIFSKSVNYLPHSVFLCQWVDHLLLTNIVNQVIEEWFHIDKVIMSAKNGLSCFNHIISVEISVSNAAKYLIGTWLVELCIKFSEDHELGQVKLHIGVVVQCRVEFRYVPLPNLNFILLTVICQIRNTIEVITFYAQIKELF